MQKYPLCQVYKYPALSFRSLFLFFSFFLSDFLFRRSVFHALPELSALSLAVAVASQQQCWVLCMGPSKGDAPQGPPRPGSSPFACPPPQISCRSSAWETREKAGGRKMVEEPGWLYFTWRTAGCPYFKDVHLCWDGQPAPKARTEERSYQKAYACRAPALPRFLPTPLASFGRGSGSKWPQVRRKALGQSHGWHAMPLAPTRPPPGPPAGGSGARLRLLLPGCPTTWPRATSANVLV